MPAIKLVVCDMAGTTVRDNREVEIVFNEAIRQTGLVPERSEINAMMGWSKIKVFSTLWQKALGVQHPLYEQKVLESYQRFTQLLEHHYTTQKVMPTEGALELFSYCKTQGISIALTTGFYRKVTDIILEKLKWLQQPDSNYISHDADTLIHCSVSSSEVAEGRPAPDMILLAMRRLGISNPLEVINIGDTPSDLLSAKNAGVRRSFGVSNGTHTKEELMAYPNDGILDHIGKLTEVISVLNKTP